MILFIDSETYLIGPGNLAPKPVCWQIAYDRGAACIVLSPDKFSLDSVELIVGHNIAYDLLCLVRHYPSHSPSVWRAYSENRVTDTMIRQKLMDIEDGIERKGYSLDALAKLYDLRKNANDPWRLRYNELDGRPLAQWPAEAIHYALHDTEVTRDIYYRQRSTPDEFRQIRAAWWLHIATANGIFTDSQAVEQLYEQYEQQRVADIELLKSEKALVKNKKGVWQKNSVRLKNIFSMHLQPGDDPLTAKGDIQISEQAIEDAVLTYGDLNPVLLAAARYSTATTREKRLALLRHPIINPRYNTLIATGRTSSSQSVQPSVSIQIQNMPRTPGMRECIVPAQGEVILAADYKSAELCAWAQICYWLFGHSDLREAINRGVDAHLELARLIDPINPPRQAAKAANFGFIGGLGAYGFVKYSKQIYDLVIEQDEAKRIRELWFERWSEAQKYLSWINSRENLEAPAPRKERKFEATQFRSERKRVGMRYTECANTYFQGLIADIAKDVGYHLAWECEHGELAAWKIWAFVHDEFLLRGPEEDLDRASRIVAETMIRRAELWLPDVKCGVELAAMYRWSKSAKPVYDESDKLIPWSP